MYKKMVGLIIIEVVFLGVLLGVTFNSVQENRSLMQELRYTTRLVEKKELENEKLEEELLEVKEEFEVLKDFGEWGLEND